jgi:hypothetical protein
MTTKQELRETFKGKVVSFEVNDISNEIYLSDTVTRMVDGQRSEESYDEVFSMELIKNIVEKIRGQKWFTEGNKTIGQLSFIDNIQVTLDWEVHYMTKDLDSEIDYLYHELIINPDRDTYKVIELQ